MGVDVSVGSVSPVSIPSYINRYSDWQWRPLSMDKLHVYLNLKNITGQHASYIICSYLYINV